MSRSPTVSAASPSPTATSSAPRDRAACASAYSQSSASTSPFRSCCRSARVKGSTDTPGGGRQGQQAGAAGRGSCECAG